MSNKKKQIRRQIIIFISFLFILFATYTQTKEVFKKTEYKISYEYVNIKDMSPAKVQKKEESTNIFKTIFNKIKDNGLLKEHEILKKTTTKTNALQNESKKELNLVWKLPIEIGTITQYPSYYHTAIDMTSPRTYNEPIYPVARGKVSSIYTDEAGALIVTVLHNYKGQNITSQYIHLSRYADIYVGKEVTENDILGYMGSTGNSTGPHLHIAVIDCGLYVPGDTNCYDINSFYNYSRRRFNEGFVGIGNYINVPYSWNSR